MLRKLISKCFTKIRRCPDYWMSLERTIISGSKGSCGEVMQRANSQWHHLQKRSGKQWLYL